MDFFDKCFNETIACDDFDCDSTNDLRSKVHDKLEVFHSIASLLNDETVLAEERLPRGRVSCFLATSNGTATICFDGKTSCGQSHFKRKIG